MTPRAPSRAAAFERFLAEVARRHVVRFAVGYGAAAFVLLQVAEIVLPAFGFGESVLRALVIAVALGFPPAVVLAWIFDITPRGLERTESLEELDGLPAGQSLLFAKVALVVVSVLVLGGLGAWLFMTNTAPAPDGGGGRMGTLALTEYNPDEPVTSVAVLPLDDFSPDQDQGYFTAGMQEELITQLSQIPGLRVVSRTSTARYANTDKPANVIGAELGVDALIEGSVVRDGDRVRITVQLIHAPSDTHIWSERYDRELTDVLSLQSEVAYEIVQALRAKLTPVEEERLRRYAADQDVSPAAQEAYLRGKEAVATRTREGYSDALAFFEEAVAADSSFAPAWAGMAGTRLLLSLEDSAPPSELLARAHGEALRALDLDSTSAEAQEVVEFVERSLADAEAGPAPKAAEPGRTVRTVRIPGLEDSVLVHPELLDSAWVGAITRLGSILEERLMQVRSPDARTRAVGRALRLMAAGDFRLAVEHLRTVLAADPSFARGWEILVRAEVSRGDPDGIVDAVARWAASGAEGAPSEADAARLRQAVQDRGVAGYWSWNLGRLENLAAAGEAAPHVDLAASYAGLGRTEDALRELLKALEAGEPGLAALAYDPVWDGLRGDERFQAVARQVRALRFGPHRGRLDPR